MFEKGEVDVAGNKALRKALRAGSKQALVKYMKKKMLEEMNTKIWEEQEMVSSCDY
jgi:hypothetical protein